MDTAMEANLGAAGHGPRTELGDEDYYPQGGWDTVFLVALLLLGLPANGLMAWLAGSQARHGAGTRLALLLLSLALSDFLFLGAASFQILEIQHGGHWPLGTAACRFYYFLWAVSYSSGLFLLAALSLDRCLLALCPRSYPGRRPARLPLWVCAGVWVLATLFSVPWLVFPEAITWWYDLVICLDFWDSEELPLRMLEILGGFLPFLLLFICHVLTQAAACRICRRHQPQPSACYGFARVAKTILSAYVVLRLPYQLAQLLYLAFLWDIYPGYLLWEALVYSDYLILLNSCLSPFICLMASADLRALLHTMLSSFSAALCEEQPGSFTPVEPQTQVASESPTLTAEVLPPLDPMAQLQLNPTAQSPLDAVAQPQMNPTVQPPLGPVPQPQMNPTAQPPLGPVPQPQVNPTAQPPLDPIAQPQVNPMVQPPLGPVAHPQVNPTAQPPLDAVAQPQVNPMAQPPLGPMVQPPLDPVAHPQVNPTARPQLDDMVQPQFGAEAQSQGLPKLCEEVSFSPSLDPSPEAPESSAKPATPERESPGSAPPMEAPSLGPT